MLQVIRTLLLMLSEPVFANFVLLHLLEINAVTVTNTLRKGYHAIFDFQKRNKYSVLTLLLCTIFIKLFEIVLILMFGCSNVLLILHLKHNGNDFSRYA